jgi:hypothetical protein
VDTKNALARHLDSQGKGERARIARKAGLSWLTVDAIAKGEQRPHVETAQRIEAATDGAVSAIELLGLAGVA